MPSPTTLAQPTPYGVVTHVTTTRALGLFVIVYSVAVAVACRVLDQAAIAFALRLQARLSFSLYIVALAEPGFRAFAQGSLTAWLTRSRQALFRAFALAHLIHGLWITVYFARTPATFHWDVPNVSGLVTFPLIALLLLPWSRERWNNVMAWVAAYVWLQYVGFFVMLIDIALWPDPSKGVARPELVAWYVAAIAISIAAAISAWRGRVGKSIACPGEAGEVTTRRS